jgi:hypothetical protein
METARGRPFLFSVSRKRNAQEKKKKKKKKKKASRGSPQGRNSLKLYAFIGLCYKVA